MKYVLPFITISGTTKLNEIEIKIILIKKFKNGE